MTTLREAAQQALEALEYHVEQTRPIWKTSEAIAALEAALAEPVQAWHFIDCEGECLACLIEREVKATYGNQGLAYLRRHVGGQDE